MHVSWYHTENLLFARFELNLRYKEILKYTDIYYGLSEGETRQTL